MYSNENSVTENDIEIDFKKQFNITDKPNYDIENELNDYFQHTLPNYKRDPETSGISLLKELEDKWEHVEKRKHKTKHNKLKCYISPRTQSAQIITECKDNFFKKLKQNKAQYLSSLTEFESYVNGMNTYMENIKKQNDILKHQITNEINANKQFIENNSNHTNTTNNNNKDITKGHGNKYNHPSSSSSNNNNKPKSKKSFLKPEYDDNSNVYNAYYAINSKYKRPINNIFACKELTSIEGLVYETPSYMNETNQHTLSNINNYSISESLTSKMKNVFNDITSSSNTQHDVITSPPHIPNNTTTTNIITNPNITLNNDINDNYNLTDCNFNISNNNNPQLNSLHVLEKNFDMILTKISPKINTKKLNKHIYLHNKKENLNINLNKEDEYFENLRKEAEINCGFQSNVFNYGKNKTNKTDTSYVLTDNINDKKLSKKLEENIKLLNDVMLTETTTKKNVKGGDRGNSSSNKTHMVSASFGKSRSVSMYGGGDGFNHSNNNHNGVTFKEKRVYSKNRFDDAVSKIYKANAVKVQKLISGNSSSGNYNK